MVHDPMCGDIKDDATTYRVLWDPEFVIHPYMKLIN